MTTSKKNISKNIKKRNKPLSQKIAHPVPKSGTQTTSQTPSQTNSSTMPKSKPPKSSNKKKIKNQNLVDVFSTISPGGILTPPFHRWYSKSSFPLIRFSDGRLPSQKHLLHSLPYDPNSYYYSSFKSDHTTFNHLSMISSHISHKIQQRNTAASAIRRKAKESDSLTPPWSSWSAPHCLEPLLDEALDVYSSVYPLPSTQFRQIKVKHWSKKKKYKQNKDIYILRSPDPVFKIFVEYLPPDMTYIEFKNLFPPELLSLLHIRFFSGPFSDQLLSKRVQKQTSYSNDLRSHGTLLTTPDNLHSIINTPMRTMDFSLFLPILKSQYSGNLSLPPEFLSLLDKFSSCPVFINPCGSHIPLSSSAVVCSKNPQAIQFISLFLQGRFFFSNDYFHSLSLDDSNTDIEIDTPLAVWQSTINDSLFPVTPLDPVIPKLRFIQNRNCFAQKISEKNVNFCPKKTGTMSLTQKIEINYPSKALEPPFTKKAVTTFWNEFTDTFSERTSQQFSFDSNQGFSDYSGSTSGSSRSTKGRSNPLGTGPISPLVAELLQNKTQSKRRLETKKKHKNKTHKHKGLASKSSKSYGGGNSSVNSDNQKKKKYKKYKHKRKNAKS